MLSQAYLLALQPSSLLPFTDFAFASERPKSGSLALLELYNLQIVALLYIRNMLRDKEDHLFVTSSPIIGSQLIAYAFVRDIDFNKGLELILPFAEATSLSQ